MLNIKFILLDSEYFSKYPRGLWPEASCKINAYAADPRTSTSIDWIFVAGRCSPQDHLLRCRSAGSSVMGTKRAGVGDAAGSASPFLCSSKERKRRFNSLFTAL